jgi:hypothetical protein
MQPKVMLLDEVTSALDPQSGNVVLERVTIAMLAASPEVSPRFSRTPVFGDTDPFPRGYDRDGMLGAARLLA